LFVKPCAQSRHATHPPKHATQTPPIAAPFQTPLGTFAVQIPHTLPATSFTLDMKEVYIPFFSFVTGYPSAFADWKSFSFDIGSISSGSFERIDDHMVGAGCAVPQGVGPQRRGSKAGNEPPTQRRASALLAPLAPLC